MFSIHMTHSELYVSSYIFWETDPQPLIYLCETIEVP